MVEKFRAKYGDSRLNLYAKLDLAVIVQVRSSSVMGRTGRRAETRRNCLFLTTGDESLTQAAGLIRLWTEGYVEPIEPPPEPYHETN